MVGIGSGSPDLVHGTMRVLTEFCQEVTDTQIPHVCPVILPQLVRVIGSPQVSYICGNNNVLLSYRLFYIIIIRCIVFAQELGLSTFFELYLNSFMQCLLKYQ